MRNRRAGAVIPLDPIAENRKKVCKKIFIFYLVPWIGMPGSVDYYVKQNTNASKHTTFLDLILGG